MKLTRNALLGAAGLLALSLPAHAIGTTTVTDTPVFKAQANEQVAQRRGSITDDGYGRYRDTSAGSVGFKKSKKKKASATPK